MWIHLEDKLLEKYPNTAVGYLCAEVCVKEKDIYVEALKYSLKGHLDRNGINATNFAAHPDIAIWRNIYENDFGVKAKTYRSSIEALLRRIVTGKEIWNICNIVDLYNCCSILSLLPMGGYDLDKISGGIKIRYARESETFLGLGERQRVEVQTNQVVYSDDKRIICWLWNHKDSMETCIDENSSRVLFFVDSFDSGKAQVALSMLEENLQQINCIPIEKGVLNTASPQINLNIGLRR